MRRGIVALALFAMGARAEAPERDDPRGRMEAQRIAEGVRTPEEQFAILKAAESEAVKYGLRPGAVERYAAVSGTAWVNIGPATADFEYNGGVYHKVDSGRARRIIVDPRSSGSVVYLATSGGGVWKTFDALTAVTSTTGPHWQPITEAIGSLSMGDLAMNPVANDSLLLGLGDPFDVHTPGMLHSDDGGATWSTSVALSGSYGTSSILFTATSVRNLVFDPGGAIVFAATDAGLFKSSDGGVTSAWHLIDLDGTTHHPQECWSVANAGPHIWLAACIDQTVSSGGGAIFRSADDGVSWAATTLPTSLVKRMTLASAARALNGSDKACMNGAPPTSGWRVYALAADSRNADQADVFCSDTAGSTWTSLSMTAGGRAPVNPTDDQTDLDFTHDQAFYNHMLVVDPLDPNTVFIGGNLSMGRSVDGGSTWKVMTDWLPFGLDPLNGGVQTGGLDTSHDSRNYAHADWHAAAIAHFGSTAYFYGGNDGGLIRSIDGGGGFLTGSPGSVSWEDKINRGIVSHLLYSVASGKERATTACSASADQADMAYGGLQDNGTRLRVTSGGTTYVGFNQIAGGDGFGVALGCVSGGAIGSNLISTYASLIRYSDNPGTNCPTGVSPPCFTTVVKADGTGLTPAITLDPFYTFKMKIATDLTADRSYLTPLTDNNGLGYVYQSTDGGHTWSSINGTIHTSGGTATTFPMPMVNVSAHPTASGKYAAVSLARLYVTVNGGTSWFESSILATANGPNQLSYAAFDPADATGNTVWVASKDTASGHLFKCTSAASAPSCAAQGGTSIPTAVPVNVVKLDPASSQIVYVGTEIGMYSSANGGTSFTRYGSGLPLVSVTDISIAADGSQLRIATFGRGFWEIYPNPTAPAGVLGNGDFYGNGIIDGFDLVREAGVLLTDPSSSGYNWIGNLVGTTNQIDAADFAALIAKLGGRP